MKQFVDKILNEFTTNVELKSNPLVTMLADSTAKSIALGESLDSIYLNLKNGIVAINSTVNSPVLESILASFTTAEDTLDSRIYKIAKKLNLTDKLKAISESDSASNPVVAQLVTLFNDHLTRGALDFALAESFVTSFGPHNYDKTIKAKVSEVSKYLAENRSPLTLLNAVYSLDSVPSANYSTVTKDLKTMLVNEAYSSDILKVKYGTSIPVINQLISELRILESQKTGYFTLGEGDSFTNVSNLIAPATKAKDGMIIYMNDRFVSIRESKGLTGKEAKVYVDGKFKIAEVDPTYVLEKFPKFYSVAESFATLGFSKNIDNTGVSSKAIRNFTIGFKVNEEKELDLYLNESKLNNLEEVNLMEALALETTQIKEKVITLFENSKNLFNFDFIKELTNDRTLTEATIFKLNDDFYICEKLNTAESEWKKVDEFALYEFCMTKFNYDISPIFKTKIDEKLESYSKIEEKKKSISVDISKLEQTMEKLQAAISNPDLDSDAVKKLTGIRESIDATITTLKKDYVGLDLIKQAIN